MSEVLDAAGVVVAVLSAFGVGWLVRDMQLRYRRAKARHIRRANEVRKRKGQPKIGNHQTPGMRKEMQRVQPWGPFPTTRKPASVRLGERNGKTGDQGYRLGFTADEWLEDTYQPEDELEGAPEYNELPADELAVWRGRAKPAPKPNGREIMSALLDEDGAQE